MVLPSLELIAAYINSPSHPGTGQGHFNVHVGCSAGELTAVYQPGRSDFSNELSEDTAQDRYALAKNAMFSALKILDRLNA